MTTTMTTIQKKARQRSLHRLQANVGPVQIPGLLRLKFYFKAWGPSNPCPECIREGTKCEAQTPLKIANFKKPGALRPCSRCARKRIKCGTYAGRKSSRKGKNREGGGKEKAAKSRPESLPINQNSDQGACIIDLLQQILKEMKGRKRSRDTTEGFFFKDSDDDVEKPRKRKKI